jgi:prophage regulatory protein
MDQLVKESKQQLRRLLLNQDDLRALGITFSRQHLWRMMQRGEFPAPVELGSGARKAWRAEEIEAWIRDRPRFVSEASGSEAA